MPRRVHAFGWMLRDALRSPYVRTIWVALLLTLAYALIMRAP